MLSQYLLQKEKQ
jgi:hypothetical protein